MKGTRQLGGLVAVALLYSAASSCGGGIPVRMRVDEFTMEVSLDKVMDDLFAQLQAQGVMPLGSKSLPVLWPDSLPDIQYRAVLGTPPVPVDLTPPADSPDASKYKQINKVKQVIQRIEINRLILRIEQSNLTMALPELTLQVADDKDARPDDRLAWRTIGTLPGADIGYVGDLELTFVPSGESFLNSQLMDDAKEFAIRIASKVDVDTSKNKVMPSGKAAIRLILVATFFVAPEKAI
jgi:hypothetical protein